MYIVYIQKGNLMSAQKLILNKGERLTTAKGELTDWIFLNDEINHSLTKRHVNVQCKCGRKKIISLNNIRSGSSKSCGFSPCKSRKRRRDPEVGYKAIFYVYKKHAKERNLIFDLDYDYFKSLTQQDCTYCGIKPVQIYQLKDPKTGEIRSGIPIKYNGIDRIDSNIGYHIDNVVPCCKTCNRAKSNLGLDEFKIWINNLYLKTIKNN